MSAGMTTRSPDPHRPPWDERGGRIIRALARVRLRVLRRGLLGAWLTAVVVGIGPNAAATPKLRVLGAQRLDVHGHRQRGELVVEGRLVDDVGGGLAAREVRVSASQANAEVGLQQAHACGAPAGARLDPLHVGTVAITTDDGGRFCVAAPLALGAYTVGVDAPRTELLAPAHASLDIDLSKHAVRLRFDPEPSTISLDAPPKTIEAIAELDDEETVPPPVPLPLVLSTESGPIARAQSGAAGRTVFLVPSTSLGAPGKGELRVAFAGDADTMPSEHVAPVVRTARVLLSPPVNVVGTPEDGVGLEVTARTQWGDAPSGTVEALIGDVSVGAASVGDGRAAVIATFATPPTPSASLTLRYVPDRPYYVPAGDVVVPVRVRAPSVLRQAPLVFGVLAVAAWLLAGRVARKRRTMAPPPPAKSAPSGVAHVTMVRRVEAATGLRGRVVDAHDGAPIARARVAIERPDFQEARTVASTFTDDDGAFDLGAQAVVANARLVAEGPLHSAYTTDAPRAGELEIALVSRRRRLLDRLVEWARRRGPPFDARPEPTPSHVRGASRDPATVEWAEAVERAAFDAEVVDAGKERAVEALEPGKKPPV